MQSISIQKDQLKVSYLKDPARSSVNCIATNDVDQLILLCVVPFLAILAERHYLLVSGAHTRPHFLFCTSNNGKIPANKGIDRRG